jgi:hypothetical protein
MMANLKITRQICCAELSKPSGKPVIMWCTICAKLVRMVTPEVATSYAKVDLERLKPCIENHSLHSVRTQTGSLLICLESLSATP